MTMLWGSAAGLVIATLGFLLTPLVRRRRRAMAARAEYDLTVYRDQLQEVERDLERGLLGPNQAEAARVEIQRRMLAGAEKSDSPAPGAASDKNASWALIAAIAVLVPVGAVVMYLNLGSPETPDQPLSERQHAGASGEAMISRLAERLRADPTNVEGRLLLARSYMAMNRFADAAEAFRKVLKIDGKRPGVAADYAEARIAAADGQVSAEVHEILLAVLQDDALNLKARYFLGLSLAQRGDLRGAVQSWIDLRALAPATAPWLGRLNRQIEETAGKIGVDPATLTPSPETAALIAAMPATPAAPAAETTGTTGISR